MSYADETWPLAGDDKANTEERWGTMVRVAFRDGVVPDSLMPELGVLGELEVYADGLGMYVKVKRGLGMMRGAIGYWSAEATLAIAPADAVNPRIDLVVMRQDLADPGRTLLAVKTGTPAGVPIVPEASKLAQVWEVPLAEVTVGALAASIAVDKVANRGLWAVERFEMPFVLGSGQAVINTGLTGHVPLPKNETLRVLGWQVSELDPARTGDIVVDLWHDVDRASVTDADSICGGNEPYLTAEAERAGDVSGWTKTELRGGVLVVNIDSVATVQQVTLSLDVIKIPYSAK